MSARERRLLGCCRRRGILRAVLLYAVIAMIRLFFFTRCRASFDAADVAFDTR